MLGINWPLFPPFDLSVLQVSEPYSLNMAVHLNSLCLLHSFSSQELKAGIGVGVDHGVGLEGDRAGRGTEVEAEGNSVHWTVVCGLLSQLSYPTLDPRGGTTYNEPAPAPISNQENASQTNLHSDYRPI